MGLRSDIAATLSPSRHRTLIWSADYKRSASLAVVSAKSACTRGFLEYCNVLVSKQELEHIAINEGHLTTTTSDYRPFMAQMGWYF